MAKRKATINSREDLGPLAPPQTRFLRSRKRKSPSDEISLTDDVQAALNQQGSDGKNTLVLSSTVTVVVTPLPSPQSSPLQKCAMIIDQQNEAAQQSSLEKQHGSSSEKQTEATNEAENIYLTNLAVTEEEKATVTNPIDDSQLERLNKHSDDDTNMIEKNKEENAADGCKRSPDQTGTDELHVLMLVSEDADGSSATALKNLERKQKNSQEDSSKIDVKQNTMESEAGLPAKKKQRMGVCGLTEKERRQILLIQNRENGEKGMERGEIYNDTAEPLIMSPSVSIPAYSITEQSQAEPKLQSSHCGENDRKNEVHATVTASDGTRTVCEGKEDIAPDPEQTGVPESDIPAEKTGVEGLGNQLPDFKGHTVKIMAEKLEKQKLEDGSEEVSCNSAITFHTSHKKDEVNQDATEVAQLQVITVTTAVDEKKEEMTGDAVGGDNQTGGLNCGSVEVCEATVTPSISEKKHSCETDAEPTASSSTASAEGAQTRDTADLFGFGCLDYVSDSQLNTIVLIEEVAMEKEKTNDTTECCEDATDLIHGLIRELSSLNRRVMAAHRELNSLRRSSRGSRSSMR
ncbi:uncharacterized protein LOC114433626 [Parambassis ranga]|uniref:Uncharacterized protein LOC114433626 n=1 Tax=Parambassis ranga TaxID=210632 RepID=A0A6P7HQW6_9TELE|nr:uncharacterized protein LOC114433626 [Parambassis ranga]